MQSGDVYEGLLSDDTVKTWPRFSRVLWRIQGGSALEIQGLTVDKIHGTLLVNTLPGLTVLPKKRFSGTVHRSGPS
jgi:hypothetical protein